MVFSYEERVHNVERIVQQHKKPTIFETFASQVFSPATTPGILSHTAGLKSCSHM